MASEPAKKPDWVLEFQKVNRTASPPSPPTRGAQRRRHERFLPQDAQATLAMEGLLSSIGWGKGNLARAPLDLSEGGARVLLDRRLQPGTKVKLTIEVRKFGDAIRASGVVRWCFESGTKRGDFQAGIEFVDLGEAQKKQIAAMRAWFTSSKCITLRAARGRDAEELET